MSGEEDKDDEEFRVRLKFKVRTKRTVMRREFDEWTKWYVDQRRIKR